MDAPKCKLCGKQHWSYEGHRLESVTPPITERLRVTRPVTEPHICPVCRWLHKAPKYSTNAARQRAYRERKNG